MPDQNGHPLLGECWVLREGQQEYHEGNPTLPEQVRITKLQMDVGGGEFYVTGSGSEGGHIGNQTILKFLTKYDFKDLYMGAQVLNMTNHSRPSQWDRLSDTSDDVLPGVSKATPVGYQGGNMFLASGSNPVSESTPFIDSNNVSIHSGSGWENGLTGVIRFIIGSDHHGQAVLELQKDGAWVWGQEVAKGEEAQAVWRALKRWLASSPTNQDNDVVQTVEIPFTPPN